MQQRKNCQPNQSGIHSDSSPHINHAPIGVLRSFWKNPAGKRVRVNSGTAFLISNRILITCAHNMINQTLKRDADEIQFAIIAGPSTSQQIFYKSTRKLNIWKEKTSKTFTLAPIQEQLCLILLQQSFKIYQTQFEQISLGNLKIKKLQTRKATHQSNTHQTSENRLKIVGFPASTLNNNIIQVAQQSKEELNGSLLEIQDYLIHHNIPTEKGFSGSPILAFNQQGQHYAVGIHTHRGLAPNQNSGLYFSEKIIQQIKQYVQEINQTFGLDQTVIFEGEQTCQKSQTQTEADDNDQDQWQRTSLIDDEDLLTLGSFLKINYKKE